MNHKELLKDAVGIVEATDYEKYVLWEKWHSRIQWDEHSKGMLVRIKEDDPTYISLWADTLGGRKVIFWHATSLRVDFAAIDEWFQKQLPHLNRYQTDAQNFHIIVHDIERMNRDAD